MIPPDQLRIEPWPPRHTGGQQVGVTEPGVRITHLPTGIEACCSYARSQVRNREIAINMIEAALTHPRL